MEENRFRHTARITTEAMKRVKAGGASNELMLKLGMRDEDAESTESDYAVALEYLTDNFARQADGLRTMKAANDPDARRQRSLALLLRRKEMLNSLSEAFEGRPFTTLEQDQIKWTYNIGSSFVNQISKSMGMFNVQYGVDADRGSQMANLTTTEMQQNLAEMMVRHTREASDAEAPSPAQARRFIEEVAFPLFNTMAVRAMGLAEGSRLYTMVENGVYATAAAYHIYSDPARNRFRKPFRVFFPTPYMDAFEQTDLLLLDEEGMTEDVRAELVRAFDMLSTNDYRNQLDDLSPAAKKHVYKVQVKSRANGPKDLTSEEKVERDRFASARCKSKGFDNYDYLVLNSTQARNIVQETRK